MARVVSLHGARPGGWSKERWEWIGAVAADGNLSPLARLVAVVLAQGFANHETAECRPGLPALMGKVAAPKRSVLRALADLDAAGWIDRRGGEGPGRVASYAFRWPGRDPERVPEMAPERVPDLTRTGAKSCTPPTPPYKDQPNMNHKPAPRAATKIVVPGGGRPTRFSQIVQRGTEGEADWNRWLSENGFPELGRIGRVVVVGMLEGWDMPWRFPPSAADATATRVALAYANWLRSKA